MIDRNLSPVEFAQFILGESLYPWQIKALLGVYTGNMTALVAANGSGKTTKVIAVLVAWFLWRYPKGRCALTSGSYLQVENQLFPAIKKYKDSKDFFAWRWNSTEIKTPEGGFAVGFSVDDAKRAEGWHGTLDSPFMYIVDEAKSIEDNIFTGIDRCTINFRLYASSPGGISTKFYRCFHEEGDLYYKVKATAFDCPHISQEKIEMIKRTYGEDSAIYRSSILAEFTSLEEETSISPENLKTAMENKTGRQLMLDNSFAFLDFAAGGDDNVIACCANGVAAVHAAWKQDDTTQAARKFVKELVSIGVDESNVYGDADGLGGNMVDTMADEGYYINEFHGGVSAEDKERYYNLISQVWIEGCQKIKNGDVELESCSPELFDQLTTRRIEYDMKGRIRIEPKKSLKKRGKTSPDLADALLGAIWAESNSSASWSPQPIIKTKNKYESL